jgi:hypothetical protein
MISVFQQEPSMQSHILKKHQMNLLNGKETNARNETKNPQTEPFHPVGRIHIIGNYPIHRLITGRLAWP